MSQKYSSAYEMRKRLIELIRSDGVIHDMLFSLQPSHGDMDYRVWASGTDMSKLSDKIRTQLPRVMVATSEEVDIYEQVDLETNSSPVTVYVHSFAPADQEQLAESIDARIKFLVLSTRMTNARIISSELYPTGMVVRAREGDFNDAHRITRQFRSANTGVLV